MCARQYHEKGWTRGRWVTGMYAGRKGPRTEEFMKTKARYWAVSTLPLPMAQPTVPQSKQRFSWNT